MNILITGASSGIGEALAVESAKRGDNVFLCGRSPERLEAVAAKCRSHGVEAEARVVDVADRNAMREWILECDKSRPPDRIFANAGVSTGEETEENARLTFETNICGVVNTVMPAIEIFSARRRGSRRFQIILTSSIAGYGPLKSCPSYSASKSFVKTWGLALRAALKPEGIDVSVVCPGFVRSRITDKNKCPMPFFMEADKAARIILKRVDSNAGLIAFPWPMRLGAWLMSILPQRLNEALNAFIPEKVEGQRSKGRRSKV